MVVMSPRCGRFESVSVSSVSRLAVIRGSAAFLAPLMRISPSRGWPPMILILSMDETGP